jgi:hypothetical protein
MKNSFFLFYYYRIYKCLDLDQIIKLIVHHRQISLEVLQETVQHIVESHCVRVYFEIVQYLHHQG